MNVKKLRLMLPLMMVIALACGSLTIRLDTEVLDEDDITHDLQVEAAGQIAPLLFAEWEPDALSEECDSLFDSNTFEITCKEISQADLGLGESLESNGDLHVDVTKTDMENYWEYRISMTNPYFGTEEEIKDDPLAEGLEMDAILLFRFYWSVRVPGEITESNANTSEGGEASFVVKLDDERETLFVVTRQDKPSGFLGMCNPR